MKRSRLYKYIVLLWWAVVTLFMYEFSRPLIDAFLIGDRIFLFMVLSTLFLMFLWLNIVKDLTFIFYYYKKFKNTFLPKKIYRGRPTVDLIYYTSDSFQKAAFLSSIRQSYNRTNVVILDDSSTPQAKRKVTYFARKARIPVIRREKRTGYKAGFINDYLKSHRTHYFVVTDDSLVLPRTFIEHALHYFTTKKVGAVQVGHLNKMLGSTIVEQYLQGSIIHSPIYQAVRSSHGFLTLSSHGIMVRRKAYDLTRGFYYLEGEDVCFSIDLKNKGYIVRFAPEIEYSSRQSDVASLNDRCHLTIPNYLFLLYYAKRILRAKLRWYEKLDIFLTLSTLPLSLVYAVYLLFFAFFEVMMVGTLHYNVKIQLPSLLFLSVPLLLYTTYVLRKYQEEIVYGTSVALDSAIGTYKAIRHVIAVLQKDVILSPTTKRLYEKLVLTH